MAHVPAFRFKVSFVHDQPSTVLPKLDAYVTDFIPRVGDFLRIDRPVTSSHKLAPLVVRVEEVTIDIGSDKTFTPVELFVKPA